jgi:alginate O-acetyltransferase complex protein AlgI
MLFNSLAFIFIFLPIVLIATYLVSRKKRNFLLFIASILFMLFACGTNFKSLKGIVGGFLSVDFWLLIGYVVINFFLGFGIQSQEKISTKKALLVSAILLDSVPLVLYKVLGSVPLGLSFYTFQTISYIVDVYQKKARAERSFVKFFVYMAMFPRILQGPIIRFGDLGPSLYSRRISRADLFRGLEDLIIGLGMKVILSGQVGRVWSGIQGIGIKSISTPLAWMGAIAYSLQLYFDFAGYSRMAIGMGRLMGLQLPENFNYPYISKTMGEFWRRWHMTLGSWFRDYIYIPLGGNRGGTFKTIRNMLIVWLFTGFWHGFGWNFILWGLLTFLFIILERYVIGKFLDKTPVVAHLYMLILIPLMWMVFANTDMVSLGRYFGRLFGVAGSAITPNDYVKYLQTYGLWLLGGIVFSTPAPRMLYDFLRKKVPIAVVPILLTIFWVSVYWMVKGQSDPFMYFHF